MSENYGTIWGIDRHKIAISSLNIDANIKMTQQEVRGACLWAVNRFKVQSYFGRCGLVFGLSFFYYHTPYIYTQFQSIDLDGITIKICASVIDDLLDARWLDLIGVEVGIMSQNAPVRRNLEKKKRTVCKASCVYLISENIIELIQNCAVRLANLLLFDTWFLLLTSWSARIKSSTTNFCEPDGAILNQFNDIFTY